MRKLILLLPLLITSMVYGQDYIPMVQEDVIWSVSHQKFIIKGDTLIDGMTYKKVLFHQGIRDLDENLLLYAGAIREDNEQQKVWFIPIGESSESILYDFTLQANDEITITAPFFCGHKVTPGKWETMEVTLKVKSIERTGFLKPGENNRVIKFFDKNMQESELLWIEGVGSNVGIIYPVNTFDQIMIADIAYPMLLCFYQDNSTYYLRAPIDCYHEPELEVESIDYKTDLVAFFNSSGQLMLRSKAGFSQVSILHQTGRVLYTSAYNSHPRHEFSVDTRAWPQGLYLVTIRRGNDYFTRKIVK